MEERVQCRLAAIMAADVVGYSRLMGEDEEGTLATLKAYRSVIDELIQAHDGRVFGGAGDSVIAEFASPVEAVRCATEIQLELDACQDDSRMISNPFQIQRFHTSATLRASRPRQLWRPPARPRSGRAPEGGPLASSIKWQDPIAGAPGCSDPFRRRGLGSPHQQAA